jgi:hypothetical protein
MEGAVNDRLMASRTMLLAARLHHALGWPGMAGLGLLLAAWVPLALALSPGGTEEALAAAPALVHAPRTVHLASAPLPPPSEIPLLLTQIEQAAQAQGLGWPQADYRQVAANGDAPARLEVHCTLKGAYPDLRRFVSVVLRQAPASTLSEFALSRPNSDTPTVEAHLAFVVFLQSAAGSGRTGQ